MKTRVKGFVLIGLGICLLLALFVSPFASSKPDGLEQVAQTHGFAEKGGSPGHAPLRNYSFPGIKNPKVSTALAGFVGTLSIFFLGFGIAKLVKRQGGQPPGCKSK